MTQSPRDSDYGTAYSSGLTDWRTLAGGTGAIAAVTASRSLGDCNRRRLDSGGHAAPLQPAT
jgi:hypothetical protein